MHCLFNEEIDENIELITISFRKEKAPVQGELIILFIINSIRFLVTKQITKECLDRIRNRPGSSHSFMAMMEDITVQVEAQNKIILLSQGIKISLKGTVMNHKYF